MQEPRFRTELPEADFSYGPEATDLAATVGLNADEWQESVVTRWLSVDSHDNWLNPVCAISVPRQNGKGALIEIVALYCAVALDLRVLVTAHELRTARNTFIRLLGLSEHEDIRDSIKAVRKTNGQEAILFTGGGEIHFSARTAKAGRGLSLDVLILDEANDGLNDGDLSALLPTISTSASPLTILLGTPPSPTSDAAVFTRIRHDAVDGKNSVTYDEWSIQDDLPPSKAMNDVAAHALATNPAMGYRIDMSTVEGEADSLSAPSFCRERLGQWLPRGKVASRAITDEVWTKAIGDPNGGTIRTLGISFSFDGTRCVIAGAVRAPDRSVYAELIDIATTTGEATIDAITQWLTADVQGKPRWSGFASVAICGGTATKLLERELHAAKVGKTTTHALSTPDYYDACSTALDGLKAGWLTHPKAASKDDALEASVSVCDRKERSTGWGWVATSDGGSPLPLEAFSVAAWAARTTKRNPGRRQRVL